MIEHQLTRALTKAFDQWPKIKDTVPDYGFKEWCKRANGFEFDADYAGPERQARVTVMHDEAKYSWFLLKWS